MQLSRGQRRLPRRMVFRLRPEEQVGGVGRKDFLDGRNKICKGSRVRKDIVLLWGCRCFVMANS